MGRGRYNPLAEGHVEPSGKDKDGRQTWAITVAGLRQKPSVEDGLRSLGYTENIAGLWVFHGDPEDSPCQHEPDLATLSLPQDLHPTTSDGRIEFIIDVVCTKCGTSGSFAVTVDPTDINW